MNPRRQTGAALLVGMLLLMLAIAGLTAPLLAALDRKGSDSAMLRQQLRALHDAERALRTHALIEDNTPGTLPSPSGEDAVGGRSNPVGFAGSPGQAARRLPWHFLALEPANECLWYAVSRSFRNNFPTRQRSVAAGTAINPDARGELLIHDVTGGRTFAAAVLIAPGEELNDQAIRQARKAPLCAGGSIDAFLEGRNRNNDGQFASGIVGSDGNDIVRPIVADQLLAPVLRRVLASFAADDIRQELLAASSGFHMPVTLNTIRCGFTAGEGPCPGGRAFDALLARKAPGELIYSGGCPVIGTADVTSHGHPVSWLCFNGWHEHVSYLPGERTLVVNVGDTRCTLQLDTGSIRCTSQAYGMAPDGQQASR